MKRELKDLYRKACSLCHPDKVPDDRKEAAHCAFVDLQEAYKDNDLPRLREIHEILKTGSIPGARSTTLSEAEALKAAIAELEYAITRLVAELKVLQECDGVGLMNVAGNSEADWQCFFEHQQKTLEMELARIVSDIQAAQTEEI